MQSNHDGENCRSAPQSWSSLSCIGGRGGGRPHDISRSGPSSSAPAAWAAAYVFVGAFAAASYYDDARSASGGLTQLVSIRFLRPGLTQVVSAVGDTTAAKGCRSAHAVGRLIAVKKQADIDALVGV